MNNNPTVLGFSIASKLSFQLWLRLLATFILLNIIIGMAAIVGIFIYAETTLGNVAPTIRERDFSEDAPWEAFGVQVVPYVNMSHGIDLPTSLHRYLPAETRAGVRRLSLPENPEGKWYHRLDPLTYHIGFTDNGGYELTIQLEPLVRLLRIIISAMWAVQIYTLLSSIIQNTTTIRHTLRPISELARQAQNLTTETGPYTVEEMELLAGKLDDINASALDTRIDIDATQDELKNVAIAINAMLERINQSYRAQARFVSDASHELRTPVAAIQGYVNLLDRWGKNDPAALQESIDAIKSEAANMKELIEQLLFLARGDNNTLPLQLEYFDLADLATIVIKETKMIDPGHEFESELKPAMVFADKGLIKQALRILMDNAIKYTSVGGQIKLMVVSANQKAYLTVQDEGIGIPPEAVPRVFDRFFRADESRARATGGTGLGLAISRWIAERHRGHMEITSREDIGTRVSIVLPAVDTAWPSEKDKRISKE